MITCLIVSTWSPTLASKCTASLGFVETSREPTLRISRSPWIGSKSYRVSRQYGWLTSEKASPGGSRKRCEHLVVRCGSAVFPCSPEWSGWGTVQSGFSWFFSWQTLLYLKNVTSRFWNLPIFWGSQYQHPKNINTFIRKFGIREAKKERYKNKSKDNNLTDI